MDRFHNIWERVKSRLAGWKIILTINPLYSLVKPLLERVWEWVEHAETVSWLWDITPSMKATFFAIVWWWTQHIAGSSWAVPLSCVALLAYLVVAPAQEESAKQCFSLQKNWYWALIAIVVLFVLPSFISTQPLQPLHREATVTTTRTTSAIPLHTSTELAHVKSQIASLQQQLQSAQNEVQQLRSQPTPMPVLLPHQITVEQALDFINGLRDLRGKCPITIRASVDNEALKTQLQEMIAFPGRLIGTVLGHIDDAYLKFDSDPATDSWAEAAPPWIRFKGFDYVAPMELARPLPEENIDATPTPIPISLAVSQAPHGTVVIRAPKDSKC